MTKAWDDAFINPEEVRVLVDYEHLQISLHLLNNIDADDAKRNIVAAYTEVPAAYQYDWLVDLTALSAPFSEADNIELGRVWQKIAKGRDVGRRTAFVTTDPVMQARLRQSQATSSYRMIDVFDTVDLAQNWLKSVTSSNTGVQLI